MFQVCIVGAGGVVGASIARELARCGLSVAAIEENEKPCQETSGRNSRVIHSGFHETPGTLKSRLAREGSALMIRYAEERGIPLLPTGMLIAVPYGAIRAGLWKEARALCNLWHQGRRQGIPFRFLLTAGAVRQIAPIRARAGIFIPSVRVIDVNRLVDTVIADAQQAGADFLFGAAVQNIRVSGDCHILQTREKEIEARVLINSAGLHAHEISAMAGGPSYRIDFLRGDYYELKGGVERWGIETLVYPAMPPHSRSKGIHFGPRTDGRLYIGPSATQDPEQPSKELFLNAARKFVPEIGPEDLEWAYCGVRPKHGPDFTIKLERSRPPLVNLIGIDSPGLSASMGIARRVAEIVGAIRGRGV